VKIGVVANPQHSSLDPTRIKVSRIEIDTVAKAIEYASFDIKQDDVENSSVPDKKLEVFGRTRFDGSYFPPRKTLDP
jgi:hypothetical protein